MRQKHFWDTEFLWRTLLNLIAFVVVLVLLCILYIPLKDSIDDIVVKMSRTMEPNTNASQTADDDWDRVENGIHLRTGMPFDRNFKIVRANCTSCHSPKLIMQNRATREGWKNMIVWMQDTQGLHQLGDKEEPILDYLSTHFAPEEKGRRANLDMEEIEWYILGLD